MALLISMSCASPQIAEVGALDSGPDVVRETYYRAAAGDPDAGVRLESWSSSDFDPPSASAKACAFRGGAILFRARDSFWPWKKLEYANEGLALLDSAVERAPNDIEIRFLRCSATRELPSFFGRRDESLEDLALAIEGSEDALARGEISKTVYDALLQMREESDR